MVGLVSISDFAVGRIETFRSCSSFLGLLSRFCIQVHFTFFEVFVHYTILSMVRRILPAEKLAEFGTFLVSFMHVWYADKIWSRI